MDPITALGAATSVMAVVSTAISTATAIINLVNNIQDAPQIINVLHGNLKTLKVVLDRLAKTETLIQTENEEAEGSSYPTKVAVNECNKVLENMITEILNPLQDSLKGGKIQKAWAVIRTTALDQSIKDSLVRLESSKTTLILALAADERYARKIEAHQTTPEKFSFRRTSTWGKTSKRRQSVGVDNDVGTESEALPPYQSKSPDPSFSRILTSTLENIGQEIAPNGRRARDGPSGSVIQMLWDTDLDKMQSVWNPNVETVQSLKHILNDYSCDKFLQSLKALPVTKNEVEDAAPSTLEWMWTNDVYLDWQSSRSRMLLLCGKAGSGKSVLAKTMLGKISAEADKSNPNRVAVLSYFCNARKRPKDSVLNVLKAFIFQFLRANKADFTRILENCDYMSSRWNPSKAEQFEFTFDVLWGIFLTVLDSPQKTQFYCMIDAMDECQHDANEEKFIKRLPKLFNDECKATLKFFISSRPDWMTETDFSQIPQRPLEISLRLELVREDITRIVDQEFCLIKGISTIDEDEKAILKEQIVSKANGMILWAKLAFREIRKKLAITPKWLQDVVEKLPSGLSEMYDRILQNLVKRYGGSEETPQRPHDDWESDLFLCWRIIQWVARAARPLTLAELQVAIAIDLHDTCFQDTRDKMIYSLESVVQRIPFLEIAPPDEECGNSPDELTDDWLALQPSQTMTPASTVRLIHQSAKDYLLKTGNPFGGEMESKGVHLPKFDDANIGSLCVTFLKFRDFSTGPVRDCPDGVRFVDYFREYIERFGLLEYASSFWGYHLQRVVEPDDELKSLVNSFACDSYNQVRFYCQVACFVIFGGYTDFVEDFFGLHLVASEGVDWMVQYYIDRGDNLNKKDADGRTPFMMAVGRQWMITAQILEDAGADTSLDVLGIFRYKPTKLQIAACTSDTDETAELLKKGCEVDELDSCGRTALFYACSSGALDTIIILLDANTSLSIKDRWGRIPLDLALAPNCREPIIKKMQKLGIECTPCQLSKSPCTHSASCFERTCDRCGKLIRTFYYHCCECSGNNSYDICQQCVDKGRKCLEDDHNLLRRVIADELESWLEYTPHLEDMTFEDPVEEMARMQWTETENINKQRQAIQDEEPQRKSFLRLLCC